jgi:hypothetical protein
MYLYSLFLVIFTLVVVYLCYHLLSFLTFSVGAMMVKKRKAADFFAKYDAPQAQQRVPNRVSPCGVVKL